jgi:cytochrome bd-type quinol oxidase subunit 2
MRNKDPQGHQRPARWNVGSLLAPIAGFLCAFLLVSVDVSRENFKTRRDMAVSSLFGFVILGWICVCIAVLRAERLRAMTALGFLLNTIVFLLAFMLTV